MQDGPARLLPIFGRVGGLAIGFVVLAGARVPLCYLFDATNLVGFWAGGDRLGMFIGDFYFKLCHVWGKCSELRVLMRYETRWR